jgi:menaquinone-dependent protoporphyrinogen oxidase
MRVLVAYATFDGQTRLIAERVAATLRACGHAAEATDFVAAHGVLDRCDAVIVGAAIRYGHHSRELERWVRARRDRIARLPNAFFSVCLSAGGPGAKPAEARRYVEDFRRRTGWDPGAAASFAGALRYRDYNPFIRLLMRMIVGMAGGDTDTSGNYDYTDWPAVERYARAFAARLAPERHQESDAAA